VEDSQPSRVEIPRTRLWRFWPRLTDARIDASYLSLRTLWRFGDDSDLLMEGATSAAITPALKRFSRVFLTRIETYLKLQGLVSECTCSTARIVASICTWYKNARNVPWFFNQTNAGICRGGGIPFLSSSHTSCPTLSQATGKTAGLRHRHQTNGTPIRSPGCEAPRPGWHSPVRYFSYRRGASPSKMQRRLLSNIPCHFQLTVRCKSSPTPDYICSIRSECLTDLFAVPVLYRP
jgi:hypothetical protein